MATAVLASAATITPTIGPPLYTAVNGLVTGGLFNIADTTASGAGALANNQIVNASVQKAAGNTAQLTATARAGDYIEVNSDGNLWYVSGVSSVSAGLA